MKRPRLLSKVFRRVAVLLSLFASPLWVALAARLSIYLNYDFAHLGGPR
jgi:hypothetical protein